MEIITFEQIKDQLRLDDDQAAQERDLLLEYGEAAEETVLDLIDFDKLLSGVDLVVTGEGRTDRQSCFGKVMQGVGERAAKKGVVAVGLSGSLGRDAAQIFDHGIASLMTTVDAPMSLEEAMDRAEELYYQGAVRMFRFIKAGMALNR